MTVRVLFVCMGNICRSPLAEGVFSRLAASADLLGEGKLEVDSAGTTGFHVGESPDSRAVAAARARGFDISGQRARQVDREDFERFHYVIALDRDNHARLERLAPAGGEERLSLLMSHAPKPTLDEVPDPYYGGPEGFERCLDLIEAGAHGLLARLLEQHFPDHADAANRQA